MPWSITSGCFISKRWRKSGLPFLEDNNFLPGRIEAVEQIEPAHWFVKVEPDDDGGIAANIARLTVTIDQADMSKTQSRLFRSTDEVLADIPDSAWIKIAYG